MGKIEIEFREKQNRTKRENRMKLKTYHIVLIAIVIVGFIVLLPFTSFEEIDCEELERNKPEGTIIICDDFNNPLVDGLIFVVPVMGVVGIIIIFSIPVKNKQNREEKQNEN